MQATDPWELRFDWILTAMQWAALTLGIVLSTIAAGPIPAVFAAAIVCGSYVVAVQAVPRRFRDGDIGGELVSLIGVLVALVAVALTGGNDSAYILFLIVPVFYAAAFHGFRTGIATASLATAGLAIVFGALDQNIVSPAFLQVVALLLLIAVTFAQARRILIEERLRSQELDEAREFQTKRVERLAAAHSLLVSLSNLADAAELNPVTAGEAALRDLALVVPLAAGEVSVHENGDIVVARRGEPPAGVEPSLFPIRIGDRALGRISLWPNPGDNLDEYNALVMDAIRPVALAFDNIVLLRDIARRAVREERTRVARELHDDIGPSLASLGLGIDVVLHQHDLEDNTRTQLETMRQSVTRLVEGVRGTVSDLRSDASMSLVERVYTAAADAGAEGPALLIDIDERRPPRAAIAEELGAIVTEAMRNAFEHSRAGMVRVEGIVDRDRGKVTISDDGIGFDPATSPRGHFGIIGIRERASEVEALVEISSRPGEGTVVMVTWGD
jgi:signal transduction histidine kinase